ncbi:hypothetical protein QBC47DRAFT_9908 [Echria macrotheca]|uniref:Uncharacterized protein n=1 Tax=Echria macrotheca TaxID=438768 RepID=A0AAJ0BLV5_9PEZI|nr:hypothetical protein QBC47DRAFT_9908 [Echria macrotheca]
MQRAGATPTPTATPFFSSLFGSSTTNVASSSSPAKSRPGTSSGDNNSTNTAAGGQQPAVDNSPRQPNVLHKGDRRPSFGRKSSFSASSPSKSAKKRANSSGAANGDTPIPPLPDFALAAAAKLSRESEALQSPASIDSFSKMLNRTAPTPVNAYSSAAPGAALAPPAVVAPGQSSELGVVHQNIIDTANKRISTLDYLRKAHEGRVYWFNTLLFDKPDLARMPYFDSRKLARRATNYLLLGISLPTVIDLNSNTPTEFLRSLNTLLVEFENFQSLHSETGAPASSLSRARIPNMFRRNGTSIVAKGRRSSNATTASTGSGGGGALALDTGLPLDLSEAGLMTGSTLSLSTTMTNGTGVYSTSSGGTTSTAPSSIAPSVPPASVINFAASETDLLPGEEYTHLLTPSLPFDPDFFETFATLCDVLIDTYTRLLSLVPTPRECAGGIGDLFSKVDGRVRKIIIQGVIKEFEDTSRHGAKAEVANVGRVVLGGLM